MLISFMPVEVKCSSIYVFPVGVQIPSIFSWSRDLVSEQAFRSQKGILVVAFLTDTKRFMRIAITFGAS